MAVLPEIPQLQPGPLMVAGDSPVGKLSMTETVPLVATPPVLVTVRV